MGGLPARARQLQAVSELGLVALARPELHSVAERAVRLIAEALEVEVVTVDELLDDDALIVRAAVGLGPVVERGERVGAGADSFAGYTLAAGHPVLSDDLPNDPRFSLRASFVDAGVLAGVGVAIGAGDSPWGVVIAATTRARRFTEDDIAFISSVSNLLHAVLRLEQNETELQRMADAVEQASDAIVSLDRDGYVRHWNAGAERLFGLQAEQAIGRTVEAINGLTAQPEIASVSARAAIEQVLRTGCGHHRDVRRQLDNGFIVHLAVDVTPWRIDGRIVGVTNVITDVTERRRAQDATARLAAIVMASDDAIIGKTLTGRVTSWNDSAERIYGFTAAEAVGQPISLVVPDDRLQELAEIMSSVAAGETVKHLETTRRRKDGRIIEVSLSVSPVRDAAGEIVGAATVARDITESKQVERAQAQMLRNLAEAQRLAKLGSWTRNPETGQASWTPQMYEIFGRDPAAGPATGEALLAHVHADDRERIAATFRQAFATNSDFELECRLDRNDGALRHVRVLGYADPAIPGAYVGTAQDVTDQWQAEAERAQMLSTAVRAESASRAKSEFLARMSHELRTPLNSIMGFTQLMQLEGVASGQEEHVAMVLRAARHLLGLIDEVLDLARVETGRLSVSPEPVALLRAVSGAIDLIMPLAAERGIAIHLDTAGLSADQHVSADSTRLNQVLLNLLSNAVKYNRDDGRVDITFLEVLEGLVRIRISDTGVGIGVDQLGRLFEPFERLGAEHTEVEGTGLGLALSKALVEAMGGTLEIEATTERGSSFILGLVATERPTAEGRGAPSVPTPALADPAGPAVAHAGRILYIEDNLSNLTLVQQILDRYFSVELISAIQGTLGLDLARKHLPDLIILDLNLPDTPGLEVLARLKAEPATTDIPVIVLSAEASRGTTRQALALGASVYLTKPLDVNSFVDAVADGLR